jgi:hemoglobin
MRPSLLLELGGTRGLTAAVENLYLRLLADPVTAHYFWMVDVHELRAHMVDFLVAALDGPDRYAGRDLGVAHAGLGVSEAAFDAMAGHLLDALESQGVRVQALSSVLERIAPFRTVVVSRH